jgi:hypothetical protein
MSHRPLTLPATLALVLTAPAVRAGIVDTPLPAPFTQHVFSVPGVIRRGSLATFFSCTNLDAANVTIGVEVFGSNGGAPFNDAAATSLSVPPRGTRIFGTITPVGIIIDSNLAVGSVDKGSARILATSKKLACTAFVADPANDPPTSAWQLNILAKTKQKGD